MSILHHVRPGVHSSPATLPADADGPYDDWSDPVDPVVLAGWIDRQAAAVLARDDGRDDYRAAWLGRRLRALADEARYLSAATPDDFDARSEVLYRDAVESRAAQAYAAGLADGRGADPACAVD